MTSTTTMVVAITLMLSINIGLVFLQEGITEVNPAFTNFIDKDNTPYSQYLVNGELTNETYLPTDEAVENSETGNIITDTYRSMKSWVSSKLAPLKFVGNAFKQPYGFIKDIGIKQEIAVAFGVLWYAIMLIVFVSWLMGR